MKNVFIGFFSFLAISTSHAATLGASTLNCSYWISTLAPAKDTHVPFESKRAGTFTLQKSGSACGQAYGPETIAIDKDFTIVVDARTSCNANHSFQVNLRVQNTDATPKVLARSSGQNASYDLKKIGGGVIAYSSDTMNLVEGDPGLVGKLPTGNHLNYVEVSCN